MPKKSTIRVGSHVLFNRGMFGEWKGEVVRFYERKDDKLHMAVVSYRLQNGKHGVKRIRADTLKLDKE